MNLDLIIYCIIFFIGMAVFGYSLDSGINDKRPKLMFGLSLICIGIIGALFTFFKGVLNG